MKKPVITLKEALSLLPRNKEFVLQSNIPENFKELSYYQKYKCIGCCDCVHVLDVKDNRLFFGQKSTIISRVGRNIFKEASWSNVIVFEDNKVRTSTLGPDNALSFLQLCNIHCFDDLDRCFYNFLVKPYIIKDILCRKVYSEETLCRCILSKGYKLKNFNWKLFRDYIKSLNYNYSPYFSLESLKVFTKDIEQSINVILKHINDYEFIKLLQDILDAAAKLDEVVDFTWSDKRLKQEHQRQIEIIAGLDLDEKADNPIYNEVINTDTIKQLNTEKEVYIEGNTMHHCLYSNYFNRIKNKEFIAFHMTFPEDCTFTFRVFNNNIQFDQAHLVYNGKIKDETQKLIFSFMDMYKDQLLSMMTGPNINKNPFEYNPLPDIF